MSRAKKLQETPEARIERLQTQVHDLQEMVATLRARQSMFTAAEWRRREDEAAWNEKLRQNQQRLADIARQWAESNGYPIALRGSEKQVDWAIGIRRTLVEQLRKEVSVSEAAALEATLRVQDESTWWIDRRPTHRGQSACDCLSDVMGSAQPAHRTTSFVPGNPTIIQ
jgi:hypothetical protein